MNIKVKLLHGDCLELMKEIPDNSVDMCLTDPPYGSTACKWDSVIPFEPMWKELKRIVKDNGAIALFGSEPFSSALRMSNINNFRYDWIWKKTKATLFTHANKRPLNGHEIISIFYSKLPNYYPQKKFVGIKDKRKTFNAVTNSKNFTENKLKVKARKDDGYRFPTTVQEFNNSNRTNLVHPTQKPIKLLEYLIKTYTLENETVFDFTMGSGSTGVACVNLNREFIGIEKDDKYFEIAKDRIMGV